MARFYRVVVGLVVLYVLALLVFSRLHYRSSPPDVATVARDFHRWIRERLPHGKTPVEEPGAVPPRRERATPRDPLPPAPGR